MPKSPQPGIGLVGSAVYAEHPSTRILSFAYDLMDGTGEHLWLPGDPEPFDLITHIATGGLLEAHNSLFEHFIWLNQCHGRMGWIDMPLDQWRCSASKARAHSMPGNLSKLTEVLNPELPKDSRGKKLINLLSIPRRPTKDDPSLYRTAAAHPELHAEIYEYNKTDIRSQRGVSVRLPSLSKTELAVWQLDQEINARGIAIDTEALDNCIAVFKQASERYTAELVELTGGAVTSVDLIRKGSAGGDWLHDKGVAFGSLAKDAVDALLESDTLPPVARRVLEIRQILGQASVKKLFAGERTTCADGRIRDLFMFCGADRTARWAGRGFQPQNLKNSGPDCVECSGCGYIMAASVAGPCCPTCGSVFGPERLEWGDKTAIAALKTIVSRDLDIVEQQWGSALDVITSCLRSMFIAASGHDFICSDYSAIEAVVLAAVAGEEWRLDIFRTHGKIYEASAAQAFNVPLDVILSHKATTGKHHPLRKKGKVNELACFGTNTLVLTDRGPLPIIDIKISDLVFDGVEYVSHSGVVDKGKRLTTKIGSVTVTPDHKFYLGGEEWATTDDLKQSTKHLNRALNTATSLLYKRSENRPADLLDMPANVPAGRLGYMRLTILGGVDRQGVTSALRKNPVILCLNTKTFAEIKRSAADSMAGCRLPIAGALTRIIDSLRAMGAGGSASTLNGSKIGDSGWLIFAPSMATTTQRRPLTESITIRDTLQGILDLLRIANSKVIKGLRFGLNTMIEKCQPPNFGVNTARSTVTRIPWVEKLKRVCHLLKLSSNSQDAKDRTKNVYDLVNCGPRNRYTVLTDFGPLIAHNCGYGGWIGASKAFGAIGSDEELKQNILAWRAASPAIEKLWGGQWRKEPNQWRFTPEFYGLEGAAVQAILNRGQAFSYREIVYQYHVVEDCLYCLLPSGRCLKYHEPRLNWGTNPMGNEVWQISFMGWNSDSTKGAVGWVRLSTYSGKLCENVVQAIARDILAAALLRLRAAGYKIVLHVHDEIIVEVPHGFGSVEEVERIMMIREPWFADWPIKAAGGWRGKRYRK